MRSQVVLSAEDEEVLWWVLQRHAAAACTRGGAAEDADGGPGLEGEPGLNYDEFTQVRVYHMSIDTSSCMMYHQRLLPGFPLTAQTRGGGVPATQTGRPASHLQAASAALRLLPSVGRRSDRQPTFTSRHPPSCDWLVTPAGVCPPPCSSATAWRVPRRYCW